MGEKVLSLDTIEPDRNWITIDEEKFYLRTEEELSLTTIARFRRFSTKSQEIGSDATEEQMEAAEDSIDGIVDLVMIDLPAEKKKKLRPDQRLAIISAFMTAASSRRAGTKAGGNGNPPTMAESSPGSGGSTAELSQTG
jgi:hypothetical protein